MAACGMYMRDPPQKRTGTVAGNSTVVVPRCDAPVEVSISSYQAWCPPPQHTVSTDSRTRLLSSRVSQHDGGTQRTPQGCTPPQFHPKQRVTTHDLVDAGCYVLMWRDIHPGAVAGNWCVCCATTIPTGLHTSVRPVGLRCFR